MTRLLVLNSTLCIHSIAFDICATPGLICSSLILLLHVYFGAWRMQLICVGPRIGLEISCVVSGNGSEIACCI